MPKKSQITNPSAEFLKGNAFPDFAKKLEEDSPNRFFAETSYVDTEKGFGLLFRVLYQNEAEITQSQGRYVHKMLAYIFVRDDLIIEKSDFTPLQVEAPGSEKTKEKGKKLKTIPAETQLELSYIPRSRASIEGAEKTRIKLAFENKKINDVNCIFAKNILFSLDGSQTYSFADFTIPGTIKTDLGNTINLSEITISGLEMKTPRRQAKHSNTRIAIAAAFTNKGVPPIRAQKSPGDKSDFGR